MDLRIGSIVIHCFEFEKMLEFWREALGYVLREAPSDGWVVLQDPERRGPNLSLQARETRPRARGWMHLDLYTWRAQAEVERLLGLGARRYPWRYPEGADFTVLEDPDGNLFCVVQKGEAAG